MDVKYSYYVTSEGYKVVGKDDNSFLLAGGGTTPISNFVPYTGATQNVNLGDKNLEFTTGSLSRVQNGSRVFKNVYQGYNSGTTTGILSIKFAQATTQATMFDVTIKCYGYTSKYLGEVRISFYKSSGTVINGNGAKAIISGSGNFPVNSVQVGIDGNGKVCINLGTISTAWSSYMSFEVERVEAKHTGHNNDWSQGWEHIIETVTPDIVANGGTYVSVLNNGSFATEINTAHANKPFLDVINQNLGTAHSPTFNRVNATDVLTSRLGYFGTYSASQTQGIWSMGTAYGVGTTVNAIASNMYGLAYSYIPVGGSSNTASDHEIHFVGTGTPRVSVSLMSGNIRTAGGLIKTGTASSGFWKADGTIDNSTYATTTWAVGQFVGLSGVQTISGTKTFSASPVVPDPTLNAHAANRGWAYTTFLPLTGGQLTGNLSIKHSPAIVQPTHEFKTNQIAGRNDFYLRSDSGNHIFRFTADNNHYLFDIAGGMSASNQTGFDFIQIPASNSQFRVGYYATQMPAYMSAVAGSSWTGGNMDAGGNVNAGSQVRAEGGFVHNQYNDQDALLTSDGGAIHKKDLILTKVLQTVQDFEYIDIAANPEFREYQVIVWNDAATINIPAASSDIMGMKIVIKLEQSTPIYNFYPMLEVDGRPWGTLITNNDEGVELVCVGNSWVSTSIGKTIEIVL